MMELEYGAKPGSYHLIWEVDEILVVILRYLLDNKITILNISLISKRSNQCLRSTTLWKNLGFSFYSYNDTFISQEILWHLLQERQLEFHLPDLKFEKVDYYLNNVDALKFLVAVTRSEKEARALRIPPLKELIEMHDRPDIQELSCLLLENLFANKELVTNSLRENARALFDLIWISVDKPDALSLLRVATGVFSTAIFSKMKKDVSFWGITPVLFKLMRHSDHIVQASAFTIAADQSVNGATPEFLNHPLLLTTVTSGLDHEYPPIRRQAARMLSNLVKRSDDMQRAVMTEEMFQKLITMRSDCETLNEVLFVFVHATSLEMTEEDTLIWRKYYPNVLELCHKQLRGAVDAAEDIVHKRVTKPNRKALAIRSALESIECIVRKVIIDLPNKEIIIQNLIDSEIVQLLRNLPLRKLYPSVLGTLRLITGEE